MGRVLALVVLAAASVGAAQALSVEVQSSAGPIEREHAQAVLSAMVERLDGCFESSASALATLRVNRSGSVASVRFMESSGSDGVDRCIGRVLRRARFDRASGRSTVYVRIARN